MPTYRIERRSLSKDDSAPKVEEGKFATLD